jgi:hypothetical protein
MSGGSLDDVYTRELDKANYYLDTIVETLKRVKCFEAAILTEKAMAHLREAERIRIAISDVWKAVEYRVSCDYSDEQVVEAARKLDTSTWLEPEIVKMFSGVYRVFDEAREYNKSVRLKLDSILTGHPLPTPRDQLLRQSNKSFICIRCHRRFLNEEGIIAIGRPYCIKCANTPGYVPPTHNESPLPPVVRCPGCLGLPNEHPRDECPCIWVEEIKGFVMKGMQL